MKRRRARRGGVLGILGWICLLLVSLALVTWRQTQGVARERVLRELQSEHAIVTAEKMELERKIQSLTTRSRVVRAARDRLGMHLPSDAEIVLLPLLRDSAGASYTGGRE